MEDRAAENFCDIMPKLVNYDNFNLYLNHMLLDNDYMIKFKMIRYLKDPNFNVCPSIFFCCSRTLQENIDDKNVIQLTTSNTTYFSDDRLEGLT